MRQIFLLETCFVCALMPRVGGVEDVRLWKNLGSSDSKMQ